jgi:hypothetical protein
MKIGHLRHPFDLRLSFICVVPGALNLIKSVPNSIDGGKNRNLSTELIGRKKIEIHYGSNSQLGAN